MSQEVLYTKYRPTKLSDVVGQEHVKQYLNNAASQDKIGHAYMLSGSRGCGKTTLSRIIATIVNCENGPNVEYDVDSKICKSIINGNCPDVHEFDAASNTSIDNIREIRSLSRNMPIMCRKRVFIIDECHALSNRTIGALLKTLEEPPQHSMFILATTEPNNVIETIRSRCQQFELKKLSHEDVSKRLKYICESENVGYDNTAIDLIAKSGNGSMRDAISSLEKVIIGKNKDSIGVEDVANLIGVCGQDLFLKVLKQIYEGNCANALTLIKREIAKGVAPEQVMLSILTNTHDMMLDKIFNNFNMHYIEDSVKASWVKGTGAIPLTFFINMHEILLTHFSNIKYAAKSDFVLDHAIIKCIEKQNSK